MNNFVKELCCRRKVEVIDLDYIQRRWFPRHGMHLRLPGKRLLTGLMLRASSRLCCRILPLVLEGRSGLPPPITLRFLLGSGPQAVLSTRESHCHDYRHNHQQWKFWSLHLILNSTTDRQTLWTTHVKFQVFRDPTLQQRSKLKQSNKNTQTESWSS